MRRPSNWRGGETMGKKRMSKKRQRRKGVIESLSEGKLEKGEDVLKKF
jgi:hypothetical protein